MNSVAGMLATEYNAGDGWTSGWRDVALRPPQSKDHEGHANSVFEER